MLNIILGGDAFAPTRAGTMMGSNPVRTAAATLTTLTMSGIEEASPSTFREAEVLGLKLMQEQKYEEALKGMSEVFCFCCVRVEPQIIAHPALLLLLLLFANHNIISPFYVYSLSNGSKVAGK